MSITNPSLSIITINKNNKIGLEKTIQSVIIQTYKDFEYIIIDGNSIDGSHEIIQQYKEYFVYSISEPDRGIFHAMNKGLRKASGKYVLFLNSGDLMVNEKIFNDINIEDFKEDFIYGDLILVNKNDENYYPYPKVINFRYFLDCVLPHQATFINLSLLKEYGGYSEQFQYISDWEFCLKSFAFKNVSYRHIPLAITYYDTTGLTFQKDKEELIKNERINAMRSIFSYSVIDYFNELKENEKIIEKLSRNFFFRIYKRLFL